MLKTDIELLKEIYNETIPDYMNPSLDLFGKNRFDIALNCYYKKGDVFAPCLIGSFYFAGRGGLNVDLDRAIHWYKISFLKGESITAGINLGRIYTYQKQYQKAFKIYTKLATINHHQALTALGFFYKNGLYVKKDLNKALKYYQKGYKYGNLAAPVGIAIIYRKQHKYIKSLLLIIKVIGLRVISLFKGTLDEDTRMI